MRKVLKRVACGLLVLACLSCGTSTDIQPVVIDLSAAKTPAPTQTPAPAPPPRPTSTPVAPPTPPPLSPVPASASPRHDLAAVAAPEAVARRRMDAYNRRDLEELAALYAADARIYEPPERLRDSGLAAIRADYARRFASSPTAVTVGERMTEGGYVVEREMETDPSGRSRSALVVSEVRDGKITRVWILG